MASFSRLPSGLWRAQIERRGVRMSQSFRTKGAAQAWATQQEARILDGEVARWPRKTLGDALARYEREITPTKRAPKVDVVSFGLLRREHPALCARVLSEITTAELAAWRDERLRHVTGATVQRYINVLRHLWNVAAREWQWTPTPTPWAALRMPPTAAPRDRLITWRDARALGRRRNYKTGVLPSSSREQAGWALAVALRTGLRASEIVNLTRESVDLQARVVTLATHKTVHLTGRARRVPVTRQAARLLGALCAPGFPRLFTLSAGVLDTLFRRARDQLLLHDIHFHDSRATALTHLARRVDVMTLARISGHRDLRILLNTYYRESEASIAARL